MVPVRDDSSPQWLLPAQEGHRSTPDGVLTGPPDLHTASGLKMLVCWPRLRLRYNPLGVPMSAPLKVSEDADSTALMDTAAQHAGLTCDFWHLSQALEDFYDVHLDELPLVMADCFASGAGIGRDQILAALRSTSSDENVHLQQLAPAPLLILALALRNSADDVHTSALDIASRHTLSDHAFTSYLQKSWTTLSLPEEETVTLQLLAAAFMTFYWVRPYHGLGLLQSIQSVLRNYHRKNPRSG